MNNEKTLKVLSTVTFGFALIRVLYYLINTVSNIINTFDNPLIPKYLWKFAVFPQFILVIVFTIIGGYCYLSFKKERYNSFLIWALFIYSILFIFIGSYVYEFINRFNPYA
ncbi:hypothetical protein WNY78_06045 [Psychroserpens sp. AS72]|uniref:hypothetical protein n=1 Tax=Psychroserpens sp. AS72 TaxID=3135775 RepID=UPI0031811520